MKKSSFKIIVPQQALDNLVIKTQKESFSIWIQIGNISYPEVNWVDTPLVILPWWIHSVIEYAKKNSRDPIELMFMEGPYVLFLESEDTNFFKIYDEWGDIDFLIHKKDFYREFIQLLSILSRKIGKNSLETEELGKIYLYLEEKIKKLVNISKIKS